VKQQQAIKIMPLGDSITDGYNVPGGYRTDLWQALHERGDRIKFVGSQENGPPELPHRHHEGYPGWRIDELHRHVGDWLQAAQPDIILLLIGTNDIVQGYDLERAPARLDALIDDLFRHCPEVQVFVGSIPPIDEPHLNARVQAYNQAIAQRIQARQVQGDRLIFVDLYAGLTSEDLADGIHPNRQGHRKIAQTWYESLTANW
jgi:lysophospholipase L1-like esterase